MKKKIVLHYDDSEREALISMLNVRGICELLYSVDCPERAKRLNILDRIKKLIRRKTK